MIHTPKNLMAELAVTRPACSGYKYLDAALRPLLFMLPSIIQLHRHYEGSEYTVRRAIIREHNLRGHAR